MATEIYQITETDDTILIVNEVEETVVFIATERNGEDGQDGEDGREIELQNSGTHIQWRYVGDVSWTNIIAIADITGADGADGDDADQIELQATVTHIQWRYVGGAWTNLIALSDITGPSGTTDHNALTNLSVDSHPIYAFLAGRSGGQTIIGGTGVSDALTLQGTSGNGTLTDNALRVLVGNNGATEALSVKNNGYIDVAQRINFGTTTGTGRINLPDAGTTAADGIAFGTGNSNLYRSAAGTLKTDGELFAVNFRTGAGVFQSNTLYVSNGGGLFLGYGGGGGGLNFLPNSGTTVFASLATTGQFNFTPPSLTGSSATSALSITQTWNTTGNPTAIFANITNTASGPSAKLMDLQVDGVSVVDVRLNRMHVGVGTGSVGSDATPTLLFGSTLNNGFYVDASRIFVKAAGVFSAGFTSTGMIGNSYFLDNRLWNTLTNPVIVLLRTTAAGLTSGIAGTTVGDISLVTNNISRLYASFSGQIGIGTTTPNTRAILDVTSTTQGSMPFPRMTTAQRDAIATVAGDAGLTIFNTTTTKLEVWDGAAWQQAW